jgi:serine/threonine protein kinase
MHSMTPPLAHRDLKPHNVLLRLRQAGSEGGAVQGQGTAQQAKQQQQEKQQEQEETGQPSDEQPWQPQWGGGTSGGAAVVPVCEEGGQGGPQQQQRKRDVADAPQEWWERRLAAWRQRYEAVLMDFGSTRPAPVQVRNRAEAVAVQEDAEVRLHWGADCLSSSSAGGWRAACCASSWALLEEGTGMAAAARLRTSLRTREAVHSGLCGWPEAAPLDTAALPLPLFGTHAADVYCPVPPAGALGRPLLLHNW